MQIQPKFKSSSSEESGGEERRGSAFGGQFCRGLPRQSDSDERREGSPGTGNAAQKGKSGMQGMQGGMWRRNAGEGGWRRKLES